MVSFIIFIIEISGRRAMRIRSALYLALLLMLLAACGRPDALGTSASTQPPVTPQAAGDDIARLLQNPPAPGTSVEIDAYVWHGWSDREGSSSIDHDAHGCPILSGATTLLTDQPTPWLISILNEWFANATPDYPPDSATWLVMNGDDRIPYHARLRGHLGDPSTAPCSFAKHIFTLEGIVTTYEQHPPDLREIKVPDTYPNWLRYHDPDLGYSFRYPADWKVETLPAAGLVAALAVRSPQHPDDPILVRVHAGETYYDQYNSANPPPLLKSEGFFGLFEQANIHVKSTVDHQHLTGYYTRYTLPDGHSQQTTVFLNAGGRTYELILRYPMGLEASRDLTDTYTLFVLGFQFDVPPGPTPMPPIKQALGQGPFLNRDQIFALVRKQYGAEATLLDGQLVSEAAARKNADSCSNFQGHPEGVWAITIHGIADGEPGTIRLQLDATTGAELCREIAPDPKTPTPLPTATPTPASPYPAP
jgi:hypothetical protein